MKERVSVGNLYFSFFSLPHIFYSPPLACDILQNIHSCYLNSDAFLEPGVYILHKIHFFPLLQMFLFFFPPSFFQQGRK